MKTISIEEEVWNLLNSRITAISEYLQKLEDTNYDDLWLNNHEACQYLNTSEKTLWLMRPNEDFSCSKIYDQYFYGTIINMLNANVVQTSSKYVQELMAKGKSYIEKERKLKKNKNYRQFKSISR